MNVTKSLSNNESSSFDGFRASFDEFLNANQYASSDPRGAGSFSDDIWDFFDSNDSISDAGDSDLFDLQGVQDARSGSAPEVELCTSLKQTTFMDQECKQQQLPQPTPANTSDQSFSPASGTPRRLAAVEAPRGPHYASAGGLQKPAAHPSMAQPSFSRLPTPHSWIRKIETSAEKYAGAPRYLASPPSPPSTDMQDWENTSPTHPVHQNMAAGSFNSFFQHSHDNNDKVSPAFTPQTSPVLGAEEGLAQTYWHPASEQSTPFIAHGALPHFTSPSYSSPNLNSEFAWDYEQPCNGWDNSFSNQTYSQSHVIPWCPPQQAVGCRPSIPTPRPSISAVMQSSSTQQVCNPPSNPGNDGLGIRYSSNGFPMPPPVPQDSPYPYQNHQRRRVKSYSASGTPARVFRQCRSPSPSPSPSKTPHSPSKTQHAGTGIQKPAPQRRHLRRTKTATGSLRGTQSSAGASPKPFNLGFINFTDKDGDKISKGVAPSGSSKTRDRREREAAERRRKISMIAQKAILDAGGDIETLKEKGLLEED